VCDCDDGLCPSRGSMNTVNRSLEKPSHKFDNNLLHNANESTRFAAFAYWINNPGPVNPGIKNLKYKRKKVTPSSSKH
jgi:hypothetical protein